MSKALIDRLRLEESHTGDPAYAKPRILAEATVVLELKDDGLLAVLEHEDRLRVSFCVFRFESGPGSDGSPVFYTVVFYGEGPSGALREMRHTRWGDPSGYLFDPSGALIGDAFAKLSKWFDCRPPLSPEVEAIAAWVAGDGTDAQRLALADGIRQGLPAHK